MSSRAKVFDQENLIDITKCQFFRIREAMKQNRLLAFTNNAYEGSSNGVWCLKTEQSVNGVYLLVEYMRSKPEGGLAPAMKVDKAFYQAYLDDPGSVKHSACS